MYTYKNNLNKHISKLFANYTSYYPKSHEIISEY